MSRPACPGCGKRSGRWGCNHCGYSAGEQIRTVDEVLAEYVGNAWCDVDLHAFARAVVAADRRATREAIREAEEASSDIRDGEPCIRRDAALACVGRRRK